MLKLQSFLHNHLKMTIGELVKKNLENVERDIKVIKELCGRATTSEPRGQDHVKRSKETPNQSPTTSKQLKNNDLIKDGLHAPVNKKTFAKALNNARVVPEAVPGSASAGEKNLEKENSTWKIVSKRRKKQSPLIGTLNEQTTLKAEESKMWIFIGNVNKECNEDVIKGRIMKITNQSDVICEKIKTHFNTNCYKVGVKKDNYEAIMKPECWPIGIKLLRFYFKDQKNGNF